MFRVAEGKWTNYWLSADRDKGVGVYSKYSNGTHFEHFQLCRETRVALSTATVVSELQGLALALRKDNHYFHCQSGSDYVVEETTRAAKCAGVSEGLIGVDRCL